MKTLELLKWRYATKKYNGQVVPQEKIDKILEAAKLAPSSSGLQAYKIFVISNKELKEKLLATEDAYLEEGNTWGDTYWGTCDGIGKNIMGLLTMRVREEIKD